MSQALTLRFATDVEGAKKGMADLAGSVAGNMAKIAASMQGGGRAIDSTLAGTIARTVAGIGALNLALAGGAIAGFAILSAAIDQANEQLDRFVSLGQKASKLGIDVESYQRFVQALGGGKEATDALEKGLGAVKKKFEEVNQVRSLLGDLFESGYLGTFASQGLRQFDQAGDDKARLQAAVIALRELQDLGVSLAAAKVGEKLFGPEIADRIQKGKLDLTEAIAIIEGSKGSEIVSAADVQRAEDLRDRIEKAKDEIAAGITASLNLTKAGEGVLNIWGDILGVVAKAIGAMNSFIAGSQKAFSVAQTSTLDQKIAAAELNLQRDVGATPQQRQGREKILADLRAERAALLPEIKLPPVVDNDLRSSTAPPSGGPRKPTDFRELVEGLDKKKISGGGSSPSESLDQVERFINQLEKSRDVLKAELDNIGKSNVAREQAIELAKAEAAARSANRALTDDERAKILALADAQSTLRDRILDVKQAQAAAAETARYFGNTAADALGSLIFDGAKASDVLKNLASSIGKAALQSAFTGQGPLASLLGTAPLASAGSNAVGGLTGLFAGFFRAGGGDVQAGRPYTVGELGRELFVPNQNGRVMPIARGQGGGAGGATSVSLRTNNYITPAQGVTPAQLQVVLDRNNSQLARTLPAMLRESTMRYA